MDRDFPSLDGRAIAFFAAVLYSHTTWATGPTVAFQIPGGNASQTLREFYLQSRVRVLYLADTVKGIETQPVSGTLEASEALAHMLEGSGLTYEFENEFSAVIKPTESHGAMPYIASTPPSPGSGPDVPVPSPSAIEEVLVTGSYIHGVFDITSPLTPIDGREMRRTAYATVQDAVWALPLAANVTQSEIFGGDGNVTRGTGISLRGLGYAPTLVLVNGHRQPAAGTNADFVDVSNIPWSMVERIDVLADGSSALYGSDAIAGVVNILLRQDMDGAESQFRYGTAPGGGTELLASQLAGHTWRSGRLFAGYQYSERSSLAADRRAYIADADKRARGGRDFRTPASNPGNILDPITLEPLFAIPPGQDGRALDPDDLLAGTVNYRSSLADGDLLPHRRMHNLYVTASQELGESLEFFAEGRYARRETLMHPLASANTATILRVPATNAFFVDPFGDSSFVMVAYDPTGDFGRFSERGRTHSYIGTAGINLELGGSWQASIAASRGAEELQFSVLGNYDPNALSAALADPDPATAFNPFGDGPHTNPTTIAAIQALSEIGAQSSLASIHLMADGPMIRLPSGTARAAIGVEFREEELDVSSNISGLEPLRFGLGRKIAAVFGEVSMPLMGNPIDERTPSRLELSLASRYERYDDFGSTYNHKIGIRWMPLSSLKIRGSWGTSFRAPNLADLGGRSGSGLVSLRDPQSPSGRSDALVLQGSNPDLKEERARTWTAGFDLAPLAIPDLRLSLTGYSIEYRDQVIRPGFFSVFDILLHENQWSAVIKRNPSRNEVASICTDPDFFGDASQCRTHFPALILDMRKQNLTITRVRGLDLMLKKSFETNRGTFIVEMNGTHLLDFKRALTSNSDLTEVADTINNPLALRVRGSLEWHEHGPHQEGLSVHLNVNYAGRYRDVDSPARNFVGAWKTFDLGVSYRAKQHEDWTDGTELTLNVSNLLNEEPPFVDRELGYDLTNAQPIGRVISAFVSKRW